MTLVVDASVVLAALVDSTSIGDWAKNRMENEALAAPHLLPVETAHALRRAETTGSLSQDSVALAFRDLVDLAVNLYEFAPHADRIWELRTSVTAYDAWYVALAETLDTTLVTLDRRLAAAPGPSCRFETPPPD